MGIANFHTWLTSVYPNSIINNNVFRNEYNFLYLDMNFLLHYCLYSSENKPDYLLKLKNLLNNLLINYKITEKVIFVFDGPTCYSKLRLQRERRLKYIFEDFNKDELSSLLITPGTEFMSDIEKYIKTLMSDFTIKFNIPSYEISSSLIPDEGDIKIAAKIKLYGTNNNKNHLIIGNDSDLVIISVTLFPIKNIFIHELKKTDTLISINELVKNLKFPHDLALLSLLLGNDYLPKIPGTTWKSIDKSYKQTTTHSTQGLIHNGKFNIFILQNFLTNLSLNIPSRYTNLSINFNDSKIKNYLQGLLWCLNMYSTGKCSKYDYICNSSPNVTEILFYIKFHKIKLPQSLTPPLNIPSCQILLLPLKAKILLDIKYHPLQKKELSFLFDMEKCKKCQTYNETLSEFPEKDDAYKKILKKYNLHKKIHNKTLSLQQITQVVNTVNLIS